MKKVSKKNNIFTSFFSAGFNLYSADTVFTLYLKKTLTIGVLSLCVFLGRTILFEYPPDVLSYDLNRSHINVFDRWLMFPHNRTIETVADTMVKGLLILPIITPFYGTNRRYFNTWLTYGMMYIPTFFLTYGIKDIVKGFVDRYRPFIYFDGIIAGMEDVHQRSFPSGVASLAFMSATFFSYTFSAEYPDSPWRLPVIIGSYTLATGISTLVIFSGEHFITDILAGAAIGSFLGWLIPTLHRNSKNK